MHSENECCGTCKYRHHESVDDGYVCVNGDSDYCSDWTDYDFCCPDYERK